jgi:hypothetical protein
VELEVLALVHLLESLVLIKKIVAVSRPRADHSLAVVFLVDTDELLLQLLPFDTDLHMRHGMENNMLLLPPTFLVAVVAQLLPLPYRLGDKPIDIHLADLDQPLDT